MLDLGRVLVLRSKCPSELKKVPDRVRANTIYNYALHQIDGTGWRPDYALQALALLQSQDISSYDLSPFKNLQGVDISNNKINFNLEEIINLGYKKIKEKGDERVSLGILKFAQEQGADINPRRLIAYGLRKLPIDLFEGLNLLEEAKERGLVDNILTPEVDKFTPLIDIDNLLSEGDLRKIRLESYINELAGELAKQGKFGTVELIPHMHKKLGLSIDKEKFDKTIQDIAFSMIDEGNGDGLDYFFPGIGYKGHLLKGRDLSKVIEDGYRRLEKGDVEKGVRILSRAKLVGDNVNLTEKQQEQIEDYLINKIKSLRNDYCHLFNSYSLNFYTDDMKILKIAFNEEEKDTLKNAFLAKLKKLRKKNLVSLHPYLDSCDYAGVTFNEVCGVAYKELEKGRISEGLEILATALHKYPVDKYAEETGDRFLLRHFDNKNIAPFKRKIKRKLSKRSLDKKILDAGFEQVKNRDYVEGMDNLMRAEYVGIKLNFTEMLTPNEMAEVAYRTMETEFMFYYGLKLLRHAVRQGAEVEQDIFNYLNKFGKSFFV